MNCLFCNDQEKKYKPEANTNSICGSCVQLLFNADQDDLLKAHKKALEKGYLNKARAIESFLIPEGNDGKRPAKRNRKNLNRKRTHRTLGNQTKRIGRLTI